MKFVGVMFVIALACCSASSANGIKTENEVYVLNQGNFKKAVKDVKQILVAFYTPNCKECQELFPEMNRAATVLQGMQSEAKIGKVDCSANKQLCIAHRIITTPTMKVFENGVGYLHIGPREWDDIILAVTGESAR